MPALAGLQIVSGELAACGGGGIDVDLVVTGTVEGIASSRTTSQVEVRVHEVLLGDRDYAGRELLVETDSGTDGGNVGGVSFREGASYELYLRDEGGAWKTIGCMGTSQLTEDPRPEASVQGPKASSGSPSVPETGGPDVFVLAALGGLALASIGTALLWSARRLG